MICHTYIIKNFNRITYNLNTDISVIIFNIRSFNKNINNFLILLDTLYNKPDIIILTETWLINTDDPSIYFNNYNIFLNNRTLKYFSTNFLNIKIFFYIYFILYIAIKYQE